MNTFKCFFLFVITTLCLGFSSCTNRYSLNYSAHFGSIDGRYNYCFYTTSGGMGDPGYYLFKFDKNVDYKTVVDSFNNVESKTGNKWLERHQMLFNYDEISLFTSNPGIELINNRFLVMKRGGYYFGLYDLKLDTPIVNVASPATEYHYSHPRNEPRDAAKEKEAYEKYIQESLDGKIKEYIQLNSLKK